MRKITLFLVVSIMFAMIAGGAYGLEQAATEEAATEVAINVAPSIVIMVLKPDGRAAVSNSNVKYVVDIYRQTTSGRDGSLIISTYTDSRGRVKFGGLDSSMALAKGDYVAKASWGIIKEGLSNTEYTALFSEMASILGPPPADVSFSVDKSNVSFGMRFGRAPSRRMDPR
ncbi:MAG: hypothetical protein ABIH69_03705 [bacterium]